MSRTHRLVEVGAEGVEATWKFIAADTPIGISRVYDGDRKKGAEGISQPNRGTPIGRQPEIADPLLFIEREKIHNAVWPTIWRR